MKRELKLITIFVSLIIGTSQFMLQSCNQIKLIPAKITGNNVSHNKTIVSYFWGSKTDSIADCKGNGLAKVTVKYNLGYSLINVITLGIISPSNVEYECENDQLTSSKKMIIDRNNSKK